MQKLNLGCGQQVVDGWVNVDYSLGARIATTPVLGSLLRSLGLFNVNWDSRIRIHDLSTRFPWADGTVDACYTSHTVEHLSREEGAKFVAECFRVLKPRGVLRVVVPDLGFYIRGYESGSIPAESFVESMGVLYGVGKGGVKRALAPLVEFPHKCMYDTAAMQRLLASTGFTAQARGAFESEIVDIRRIEIEERTMNAVIVEGVKA